MQISREGKTFIEDQGNAVITVTGSVQDLAIKSQACQELATICAFHIDVIFRLDFLKGIFFGFEELGKSRYAPGLFFQCDQFYTMIFQLLRQPCMIWVVMGGQKIFNLAD